ncbi:Hypothetical protein LEPBI_p0036 (plasmid) [Leptospira biflexa serovar Patoc strain 'Patoc 1 (Paris)']|uniref:Uncharacterized protein n=1 Tax=Leptospira biflexa serovar Patoc (strain Patoc 1 / ATCC 23582 / Paris) TaxID=456481 RepID=B0SUG5_LEPBP|nr:Hypothetical protein LEPBI_p0036 [Leptospira biflexa serovar Patoc strain 'Patoc 1 (Paris)']
MGKGDIFLVFLGNRSVWVKIGYFIPKIGTNRVYFNKILSFQDVKS